MYALVIPMTSFTCPGWIPAPWVALPHDVMDEVMLHRLLAMDVEVVNPINAKHHDAPVLASPSFKQGGGLLPGFEAASNRCMRNLCSGFPMAHRKVLPNQHGKGDGIR